MTTAKLGVRMVDEGREKSNKRLSHGLMRKMCYKLNVINSTLCQPKTWLQPSVAGMLKVDLPCH